MRSALLFLLLLPATLLSAGNRVAIRTTRLTILCPPGWESRKTRDNYLVNLVRHYPEQKEKAARIIIRGYSQRGNRLPVFAAILADGIRKQHFTTTWRRIIKGPPIFHYSYLFEHEPFGNPYDRFLWINMRLFPYGDRYLVYTAAARSRRELEETMIVFRSIAPDKTNQSP